MKRLLQFMLIAASLYTSGCAYYDARVKPPAGLLVTVVEHPLTLDYGNTPVGHKASKVVVEKQNFYLHDVLITGILQVAWDGPSIDMLARNKGLTKIHYAEHRFMSILGIYAQSEVVIYGE